MNEFNLLVLGQSGTGKSTWINSFANYVHYETLDGALNAEPICLIPSKFTLTDDDYRQIEVSIGETDKNEGGSDGLSCTKTPKIYSFKNNGQTINVIDVPGIGDTAGTEKDEENTKMILDTVALFQDLHAICILLKSTDTRMTTEYRYCLSELLMHLHKNALDNVVFVFTNTRGSDYKPGNAYTPLNAYLQELEGLKGIHVELSRDVIYCIDNEAFRFQCAYRQHRQFRNSDPTPYARSWDESRKSTFRLINRMRQLVPHNVIETLSINEARAIILMLIQPLTAITALIQANAANYTDNFDQVVNELQKNLSVSDFDIQIEELARPRTVCTEKKCIAVEKINNTNRYVTYYKQVCHETCYLNNVPLKRCPEPALAKCNAMRGSENCHRCGCHYLKHMHIDFNQRTVLKKSAVSEKLGTVSNKLTKDAAVAELQNMIIELKNEQNFVTETMVKFAGFLQANAILEYNGDIDERLKMEIRKEEAAAQLTKSDTVVQRLRAVYEDYKRRQKILEATIRTANGVCTINSEDILSLRDELFQLPLHGAKIEEIYNRGRNKNVDNYSDKYFVTVVANHMP
uniref:AIG1-type G domain-containing protein n=1 Tax=Panagrolaimus superbus TaxID=310955 RepID=A0A914YCL2_9BILA